MYRGHAYASERVAAQGAATNPTEADQTMAHALAEAVPVGAAGLLSALGAGDEKPRMTLTLGPCAR